MSGISTTDTIFYDKQCNCLQEAISTYWKNRLTLMSFGKLFSKNIFLNLPKLSNSISLDALKNNIFSSKKTLFIVGAGPSAKDSTIFLNANRKKLFIICVDSSFNLLLDIGIVSDAIIVVESQLANEKSFIGFTNKITAINNYASTKEQIFPILIADLNSRPSIVRMFKKNFFFISEFANYTFLKKIKEVSRIQLSIQPLGSVGVIALEIAQKLLNPKQQIFFTGLDFSYSIGLTHCKNSQQHIRILAHTTRLSQIGKIDSAFAKGTTDIMGIKNKKVRTDKILMQYASLCKNLISNSNKLFYDLRTQGIDLNSKQISFSDAKKLLNKNILQDLIIQQDYKAYENRKIIEWLQNELTSLEKIKNILTGESKPTKDINISTLLKHREYLYLHFPDGDAFNIKDISFLKRLRSEVALFIKQLHLAINNYI